VAAGVVVVALILLFIFAHMVFKPLWRLLRALRRCEREKYTTMMQGKVRTRRRKCGEEPFLGGVLDWRSSAVVGVRAWCRWE
jgi:hypothetical protein